MKIPKAFHPILGVLSGWILFLVGIALVSCAFVGVIEAMKFAKPYASALVDGIIDWLHWFWYCL